MDIKELRASITTFIKECEPTTELPQLEDEFTHPIPILIEHCSGQLIMDYFERHQNDIDLDVLYIGLVETDRLGSSQSTNITEAFGEGKKGPLNNLIKTVTDLAIKESSNDYFNTISHDLAYFFRCLTNENREQMLAQLIAPAAQRGATLTWFYHRLTPQEKKFYFRKDMPFLLLPNTTTEMSPEDAKADASSRLQLLTTILEDTQPKDRDDYFLTERSKTHLNRYYITPNGHDFSHMFNILTLLPQDGIIAFIRELVVSVPFGFVQIASKNILPHLTNS